MLKKNIQLLKHNAYFWKKKQNFDALITRSDVQLIYKTWTHAHY